MSEQKRTLRSGEVAAELGLAPATIQLYARTNRIPYRLTPGRQYRFDLDEVRAILTPEILEVVEDLPDVFGTDGPFVDALSAYRDEPVSAETLRRMRVRGVRPAVRTKREPVSPAAGRPALEDLIGHASGCAVAVLRRAPELV